MTLTQSCLASAGPQEGAGRVRVVSNAVHPGWIDTPTGERLSGAPPGRRKSAAEGKPYL